MQSNYLMEHLESLSRQKRESRRLKQEEQSERARQCINVNVSEEASEENWGRAEKTMKKLFVIFLVKPTRNITNIKFL